MSKCPICKNTINNIRGLRGEDGLDVNGDPIPFWTDDPILTQRGLAGNDYKGKNPIRWVHIRELQNYYSEVETLLGMTNTTWLSVSKAEPCRHAHIEQLRIAVEAILVVMGKTMVDYFKYDRQGTEIVTTQTDWTDVDRPISGVNIDKPLIPIDTPLRALNIEELRRGMLAISNAIIMRFQNILIPGDIGSQRAYANYSTSPNPFFINTDSTNAWRLRDMRYVEVQKFQHDKISIFEGPFSSWLSNDDLTLTGTWSAHMTQNTNFMTIDYYYEDGGVWYYNYSHDAFWVSTEPISSDSDEEEHDYVFYGASRDYGGNYIDKFTCPWKKNIGTSDGSVSQVAVTTRTYPALLPELSYPITFNSTEMYIYIGGVLWESVDNFSGQTSDAKVYTISTSVVARVGTATITFGNGVNGAIPTNGASIVIEFAVGVSILWEHEARVLDSITNSQYTKLTSVDGVRNSLFVNLNNPYYMNITVNTDLDIYHDRMEITIRDEVKTGTFTDPNIYAREYGSANDFDNSWGNLTITNSHSYRRQYWFDIYNSLFGETHRTTPSVVMNPVIKEFNCTQISSVDHSSIKITQLPYSISGTVVTFPYANFLGVTQADWLANYSYSHEDTNNVYYTKGGGGAVHPGGMTLKFSRNQYRYIHIYGDFLPGVTETIENLSGDTITYHDLDQMVSIDSPLQTGESWDLSSGYYSTSQSEQLPVTFTWQVNNMWFNDSLYKYNSIDNLTLLSTFSDLSQGEQGIFTAFKSGDSGFKLYVVNASATTYDGHVKPAGDNYTYLYVSEDGITWTNPGVYKGRAYDAIPVDLGAYVPTLFIRKAITVVAA